MVGWWTSLRLVEQFFYLVGFLSTLILFAQLVLSLIGLGMHDVDADVGTPDTPDGMGMDHLDASAQHSSGLGMISFRTVIAFMVGFGWAGAIALEQGLPVILAIAAALAAGTVFMVVVYWLMRSIYKLSDSGNVDLKNAAGQSGTVYLPVPPAGKGMGQVQVTVQGRLREMSCVTDGDAALPTGVAVRVVKVLDGGTAVVRRVEVGNE